MPKSNKKILIIEDEQFILRAYKSFFEKTQYEVSYLENANQSLEKINEIKPDLIMLDLMMPQKNGFEIIKEVRQTDDFKKTPIIVLSNLSQESDKEKVKELGGQEYIVKADYTMKEILEMVEKYI